MASRNEIFLKKYNELDNLCRDKFQMYRDAKGKREQLSAIYRYAETLPQMYKEKLLNLIKLRNIIAHTDAAEAKGQSIRDLDSFIIMIKKGASPSNPDSFEVASYISHNIKKMKAEIRELDIDEEEIPFESKRKIKSELDRFLHCLENATDLQKAKRIVRDFYSYIDNIDNHPLIIAGELDDAKNEAIQGLNDSYNDVMDERKNPFVRARAREIYSRYRTMILGARTEDEVESLLEQGCDALDELL